MSLLYDIWPLLVIAGVIHIGLRLIEYHYSKLADVAEAHRDTLKEIADKVAKDQRRESDLIDAVLVGITSMQKVPDVKSGVVWSSGDAQRLMIEAVQAYLPAEKRIAKISSSTPKDEQT